MGRSSLAARATGAAWIVVSVAARGAPVLIRTAIKFGPMVDRSRSFARLLVAMGAIAILCGVIAIAFLGVLARYPSASKAVLADARQRKRDQELFFLPDGELLREEVASLERSWRKGEVSDTQLRELLGEALLGLQERQAYLSQSRRRARSCAGELEQISRQIQHCRSLLGDLS